MPQRVLKELIPKNLKHGTGGSAQLVMCLTCKQENLNSTPRSQFKKKSTEGPHDVISALGRQRQMGL